MSRGYGIGLNLIGTPFLFGGIYKKETPPDSLYAVFQGPLTLDADEAVGLTPEGDPYAFRDGEGGHPISQATSDWDVFFVTAPVDLGFPQLDKVWHRVRVRYNPGDYRGIHVDYSVYYKIPGDEPDQFLEAAPTGWTKLGELPEDDETQVVDLSFPDGVVSKSVQIAVAVDVALGEAHLDPLRIYSIEVEGTYIGRGRKRIFLRAVVTDNLELLNGTVENSAAHISATLFSMSGSGLVYCAALPYPPPVGNTIKCKVELGDIGAIVPVLPTSYSSIPSGVPGAEVSLILTEV